MKSNASAGFKSKPPPEGIASTVPTGPAIDEKKDKSEEEHFKELEEEVHRLLEESATAKVKKNVNEALQKAKESTYAKLTLLWGAPCRSLKRTQKNG